MKDRQTLDKAIKSRKQGHSFREISEIFNISKSTACLWTRGINLNSKARQRLAKLQEVGRQKSALTKSSQRKERDRRIAASAFKTVKEVKLNEDHQKIICSLMYWCEGGKMDKGRVNFINSDPQLIRYFLKLFRKSFTVEENKFRALIHLHDYHNDEDQKKFWSDVTKIPITQFTHSYRKKNTGKNIRANYPGCISVRYYDIRIQKEMVFICRKLFGE